MKWKLTIAIVALLFINSLIFTSVADIQSYKKDIIDNEIKATTDKVFSKEKDEIKKRNIRFEKVLYSIPHAKKRLGFHVPAVTKEVFETCEAYKEEGLTLPILMGIIEVESNYNPLAIGRGKDGIVPESFGLMQVRAETAKSIFEALGYKWDSELMMQPAINIEVGSVYLVFLHSQFVKAKIEKKHEFHVTLAAYNKGVTEVLKDMKMGNLPSFKYSNKVKIASYKWEKAGF